MFGLPIPFFFLYVFAVFNDKGICFLDGIITVNRDFLDMFLMKCVNSESNTYKVNSMDPEKNRFHEFIDGKQLSNCMPL